MAVTVESFLNGFPEFRSAGTDLIQEKINDAVNEIYTPYWGTSADLGVKLLTAHGLATSPFGQNAKLSADDGSSIYQRRHEELVRKVSPGFMVI